jgi:hypothetical protein
LKRLSISAYLAVTAMLMATLACGGSKASQIPQPPAGRITVDETAANRLKQNFNQAMQEASGDNDFYLPVTDEEITSLVALNIDELPEVPLSNPQIWFTAGRIHISGDLQAGGSLTFKSFIALVPVLNDGRLEVQVHEAKMGPFEFPSGALTTITETINENLADVQADLKIMRLEVLEGELFIIGKRS